MVRRREHEEGERYRPANSRWERRPTRTGFPPRCPQVPGPSKVWPVPVEVTNHAHWQTREQRAGDRKRQQLAKANGPSSSGSHEKWIAGRWRPLPPAEHRSTRACDVANRPQGKQGRLTPAGARSPEDVPPSATGRLWTRRLAVEVGRPAQHCVEHSSENSSIGRPTRAVRGYRSPSVWLAWVPPTAPEQRMVLRRTSPRGSPANLGAVVAGELHRVAGRLPCAGPRPALWPPSAATQPGRAAQRHVLALGVVHGARAAGGEVVTALPEVYSVHRTSCRIVRAAAAVAEVPHLLGADLRHHATVAHDGNR